MLPSSSQVEVTKVKVDLGGRSYVIHIGSGLLTQAGDLFREVAPKSSVLVVTDVNVAAFHLETLQKSLEKASIRVAVHVLPAGETTKSWPYLEKVVEAILTNRLERGDVVLALGGGVIGDLTGFAAAITRRGMRFIQVPTSLLAQVDSSVGGKTGINSPLGKNLIGAFYQPQLVLADMDVLDTLPKREFRAGYAEIIKYGLIDRPDFFDWLEQGAWRELFAGGEGAGKEVRKRAIAVACEAKAAIVARDETETGDRALLNLGHTFGHALEARVNYDSARLVHGEGVAIGMALAHRFSVFLGLCSEAVAARVEAHLQAVGLPTRLQDVPGGVGDGEAILTAMLQDKKVERGALTFILTRGIGQSFIAKGIEQEKVRAFLEQSI